MRNDGGFHFMLLVRGASAKEIASRIRHALSSPQPSLIALSELQGPLTLAVVGKDRDSILCGLNESLSSLDQGKAFRLDGRAYFESEPYGAESLAFLFPGQGSQSVGMLKGLRSVDARFSEIYGNLTREFYQITQSRIDEIIDGDDATLRNTRNAQPAIGIVSAALAQRLVDFGITPKWRAGHSYGELVALWSAGAYDTETFLKLSYERGRILDESTRLAPGSMIAVNADSASIRKHCLEVSPHLVLANLNSEEQTVVSGPSDCIQKLKAHLEKRGVAATVLKTSCAFHSPLIAPAVPTWSEALSHLAPGFKAYAHESVLSNVTAESYPGDPAVIAHYLSRQVVEPVRWREIILKLYRQGARIFVEVGPGKVLADLTRKNLQGQPFVALALDSRNEDPREHLSGVLAQLASHGVPMMSALPPEQQVQVQADDSIVEYFRSSKKVLEAYFDQQSKMIPLTLESCSPEEQQEVLKNFHASNFEVMKSFFQATESALSALGRPAVEVPIQVKALEVPAAPSVSLSQGTLAIPGNDKLEWIRQELARVTGFPIESIHEKTSLVDDLALDSITVAEVVISFVEKFASGSPVQQDAFANIKTVGELIAAAEPKTATPPPAPVPTVSPPAKVKPTIQKELHGFDLAVQRIAEHQGLSPDQVTLDADLEDDLGLDVFTKEQIFNDVFKEDAAYRLAGQESFNARSLGALKVLLDRLRGEEESSDSSQPAEVSSLLRFELELEEHLSPALSGSFPARILLVSHTKSQLLDRVIASLSRHKVSAHLLRFESGSWVFADGSKIDYTNEEGLEKHLNEFWVGSARHEIPCLVLADHLSANELGWEQSLQWSGSALFILARALARPELSSPGSRFALLGSQPGARGFARSLIKEWRDRAVVSIGVQESLSDRELGKALEIALQSNHSIELMLKDQQTYTERLRRKPYGAREQIKRLGKDSNVLIIGGGTGIAAEIGIALAAHAGCHVIAIGRTQAATPSELEETAAIQDDSELKRKVYDELNKKALALGQPAPHASEVQKRFLKLQRQRAIQDTAKRVQETGGSFSYFQADMTDEVQVRKVLLEIREAHGSLHGLIHGAGLIEDSILTKKSLSSFQSVFFTKTRALQALKEHAKGESLRFAFFLSSIASYTGTPGQTDYAAANEILNAFAEAWNGEASFPVRSLLFSVWNESGLTSPAFRQAMARQGLHGISNLAGSRAVIEEIESRDRPGRVVLSPLSTLVYAIGDDSSKGLCQQAQGKSSREGQGK